MVVIDSTTKKYFDKAAAYSSAFEELKENYPDIDEHAVQYEESVTTEGKTSVRAYVPNVGYSSAYTF